MQNSLEAKQSRREFFRSATRHCSLAALAALAGALLRRQQVDATAAAGCPGNRFCRECSRLRFCTLPPAPAARLALKSFPP